MRNGGICVLKDDMAEILKMFQKADVLVLATPVYFYGISAQMKTFIDRTYPIWQHLGKKEVYYIISAGLGEDMRKWTNDDRMMIACCNDGTRPVIFKIERIDIPENEEEKQWLEKQNFKNTADDAYTG